MCAIFGMTSVLPDGLLDRVSRVLAHRGPDAEGRRVDEHLSLLHRRLKIIDLSELAAQPMTNEDSQVWVVFNGEIYNHRILRRELERAGHTFKSQSDTETIVHGYEEWGDEVVQHLDGMFAFAVWDRRRKRLLIARDRVGKKPLFYSFQQGVLAFASTVAALRTAGVACTPSMGSLAYYLAYGFAPAPHTHFREVSQLEPGTFLTFELGGTPRVESYWQPAFVEARPAPPYAEAMQRVRQLVFEAVERRLESDVPLGAFLSGGIDSTIIVGALAKLAGRVRTFSIGFSDDARYDETRYARIAAQAFDTDHTEFVVQSHALELLPALVAHHDGPFGDSSAVPTWIVSQLTREHVTVALTGDGGDELFCGYSRFLAAGAADALPQVVRSLASKLSSAIPSTRHERTLLHRGRRFLEAAALPPADRLARWNSFFAAPETILRPEALSQIDASAPLAWQRRIYALGRGESLGRILEHNFRTYLPSDLLVKADRTSMAHALELRSPFLDLALIEYVSKLPASYLRRGTRTKRILKDAFVDLIPPEIQRRGKMGFGVPLGHWFRHAMKDYLVDHLNTRARLTEFLQPGAVQRLVDEHLKGHADHGQRLWLLLTLEVWLRLGDAAPLHAAA